MSYYSYATQTETEQYLFFKAPSDVYYYHVDEFKSITAHIPLYLKNAMIMKMEDKLNTHELKSMPDMKGLENPGENHTVIQTQKFIQLET